MKPNVGEKERYVRLGLGVLAGLAAIKYARSPKVSALLGVMAASGIETGLSRYCPMSDVLGIDNAPNVTESPLHRH